MKAFLGTIIDKLQATFPPNRLMLILAGPITAASVWTSSWVATHVPGVTLPVGVIAGVIGVCALITITLLYKWFDQWQKGEPVDYGEDVQQALDEWAGDADLKVVLSGAFGTVQGLGTALADLRGRLERGEIGETEVRVAVAGLADAIDSFLVHHNEAPIPPVASPPAEAAPPAAPQPAE